MFFYLLPVDSRTGVSVHAAFVITQASFSKLPSERQVGTLPHGMQEVFPGIGERPCFPVACVTEARKIFATTA